MTESRDLFAEGLDDVPDEIVWMPDSHGRFGFENA
jgi:hypothetical protein